MKLCYAFVLLVMSHLLAAQDRPYTSSFVGSMGVDTVLVETYTVVGNHLYGKAFIRVPEDYIGQFSIHFYPDGSIREFNVCAMDPTNSSLPFEARTGAFEYRLNMNCAGDSCVFYNSIKGSAQERVYKHKADKMNFVGGWVPLISLIEWNCMRLAASGQDVLPLKMINHNLGVYPINVHLANNMSKDTIIFGGPFLDYTRIKVNHKGRIESVDGTGTPWNYIVRRHDPIDVDVIARRMTKTKGIGMPSPEKDVTVTVDDCTIDLHYGGPLKRGRKIFGGIVPYDSIWRTGAGSPTTISFTRDIRIGKTIISKGKYSVYTIPSKDNWKLIFNQDLNTWPTNPNRDMDFASVVIPVSRATTLHDQFNIEITDTKKGGAIRFAWDDTIAICEFSVR